MIDDVSFPKCGTSSVGVARQYCGALGKRANCQVAVSVHAATDAASCPLDWQLYLPREWTDEPGRCRKAGVPQGTGHQEKWRLALGLLDVLAEWGLKAPVVVADAGYGVSTPFRLALEERGLAYVPALTGKGRRPEGGRRALPVGRRPAPTRGAGGMACRAGGSDRLLDVEPSRHHTCRGTRAVGEDALADRTRLPRTQTRPRPGPLRGPHLARLAPPRHPRHRCPGLSHPPAARPKGTHAGLTLYQVLDTLQDLLRCWTGTCTTCGRPLTTSRTGART